MFEENFFENFFLIFKVSNRR